MEINKSSIHALAAIGARLDIEDIERRLALYFREWPEMFLSVTPPVLLKPQGNGHLTATILPKTSAWTPERRAQQAAAMRARAKKRKKPTMIGAVMAHLKANGETQLTDLAKTFDKPLNSVSASIVPAVKDGRIKRIAKGRYVLGKIKA